MKLRYILAFLTISDRRDRRNPRHPVVGRARAPDLYNARSKIGSKDNKHHQPRGGRVKIFNDKSYLKAVKVRGNKSVLKNL